MGCSAGWGESERVGVSAVSEVVRRKAAVRVLFLALAGIFYSHDNPSNLQAGGRAIRKRCAVTFSNMDVFARAGVGSDWNHWR